MVLTLLFTHVGVEMALVTGPVTAGATLRSGG
jgi:hypothetical protein